jgi:hypothetical protein
MKSIPIIIEQRRANGYRKPGHFYLVGQAVNYQCCQLPKPLPDNSVPVAGIQDWPSDIFDILKAGDICLNNNCPIGGESLQPIAGLMWIPENEYSSAAIFFQEIRTQQVQIEVAEQAGLVDMIGKYMLLAHRKAIVDYSDGPFGWVDSHTLEAHTTVKYKPGIFAMFQISSIQFLTHQQKVTNRYKNVYKRYQRAGIEIITMITEDDFQAQGFAPVTTIPLE